jgi:hypothetical protein
MNVMAAPNRSVITARIGAIDAVEGQPKWYLAVEVLESKAIEGGLFVHAGEAARVFSVGEQPGLRVGDVFRAEVEYVGGPSGGELQLLRFDEQPPSPDDPPGEVV